MANNVNTKIYDKTVDRAAMVRLFENDSHKKIDTILGAHTIRTDDLIKGSKNFNHFKIRFRKELIKTYREAFNTSKKSLLGLAGDQTSFAYQNLESSMSKIWKSKRPTRRISDDIVLKKPLFKNKTLLQGWAGVSSNERKRMESVIRKGLSEGDTFDTIARDVRRGSVHKITRNQSRALVTTGITSVTAQVDQQVYMANKDAIRGWQYVAVLDGRTTPVCSHRDGQVYPVANTAMLPPAHFNCRSTTIPIVKKWDDLAKLEGVAQVRKRNLKGLSKDQIAFYDGQSPLKESYNTWLLRQPKKVQYKHLGDYKSVQLLNEGKLTVDKFTSPDGRSLGIKDLRMATDSGYTAANDTRRFGAAKDKLDSIHLGATSPDDFLSDPLLRKNLKEYYNLQSRELDGVLSLTNYRGNLVGTKRSQKRRVLQNPPREDQMIFNAISGRYEDSRVFRPNPSVHANNLRLLDESSILKKADKDFIRSFDNDLSKSMGVNERAVVVDNLRNIFTRYRNKPEPWANFKAVSTNQIKFDVMNISDSIETQLRRENNLLSRLKQDNYIDSILGPIEMDSLHDDFINAITARNKWERKVAPKLARELQPIFDLELPPKILVRLSDADKQQIYTRIAHRLSLSDSPDFDQLATSIGRDFYNSANFNGTRRQWYTLGKKVLESKRAKKFYALETFGVQKRRMKNKLSGQYYGPYYDTFSLNLRIVDPRIQEYSKLNRKIAVGLRMPVTDDRNRLVFREGYKTYHIKRGPFYEDSGIPVTSTDSFGDFPAEFIDKEFTKAMNWAAKAKYKVDDDFYDFTNKLLNFRDDKGRAAHYDGLNELKKYLVSRSDSYERFQTMSWLRKNGRSFSNHPFIDSRARVYDRGFISPQSGETFRPFLNTEVQKELGVLGFKNYEDTVGGFLGGLDDFFEGRYNSLSFTGRQKIAAKWRPELVKIGNHMIRQKPNDLRAILDNPIVARIDGEELPKFLRFAIESAKVDNHLKGSYTAKSLKALDKYKTGLALEQDASSSGAQIIALTTKNKKLAELSNVIPTTQKRRLYDEIAASTFNDPRFRKINQRLRLTEKDLRKAAKAQNMVTFYGAGERTAIMNIEGKLSKILEKDGKTLVVKASERDKVLNEISAQIARLERFDPDGANELRTLRVNVRDTFNKGTSPGDELMEELWFLDPETKLLVEKLSKTYDSTITPNDFKLIGEIMSEELATQVPILKVFTKYFGRLAEQFLINAKPSSSDFDWTTIAKKKILGDSTKGYVLPDFISDLLDLKRGEPLAEKALKNFGVWKPNGTLAQIIYGVKDPTRRRSGAKYLKVDFLQLKNISEVEVFKANELPKSWTNVPWVNFDGKKLEQNFTQTIEQRLTYQDADGNWVNNILQVPQRTEATWWEQVINKSGKINDVANSQKARTSYPVSGNHSNDAVLVKRFHLWGEKNGVATSTIHDAFFTNAADIVKARSALRKIYADSLNNNSVKLTLDEMLKRGLPRDIYNAYLNEAIELGIIPIPGRSRVGGRLLKDTDILSREDILREVPEVFEDDLGWYGVG